MLEIRNRSDATSSRLYVVRDLLSLPYASLIAASFVLASFSNLAANDNNQQLKSIQQNIAVKEKNVKQQQKQRSSLQEQLKAQEKSIAQASRALRDTQTTLANLNRNISKLTASIKALQSKERKQTQLLKEQLDMAFRLGKQSGIQALLSGEEGQRSERMLAYFGYLNEERKKNITDLKKTRETLNSRKRELLTAQNKQKSVLQIQRKAEVQLEQARANRQKTLVSLEGSIAVNQKELAQLRQNERSLRDKIAKAEREARARAEREAREAAKLRAQVKVKQEQAQKKGTTYKPTATEQSLIARTGGLGRPAGQAMWPVRGRTIHSFGEPLQGELRWKGIVIAAREGSEVRAIAAGRVLLADWLQGYGLVVVIEHGKGDMSLYGYNQSALVNVGASVSAGQPIALVGNSGGQDQSALYFEIRRQGQAVNPIPWLGR